MAKTGTRKDHVDEFLKQESFALLGVSRKKGKFGNIVFKHLKKHNYRVYPVNPNADTIEGETCYNDLLSLPEPVGGAIVVLPPAQTEKVVKDLVQAGISRVWMQQGAQSHEAIDYCNAHNVTVIANECILMFAHPVAGIHKFHHWLWKIFNKLPH